MLGLKPQLLRVAARDFSRSCVLLRRTESSTRPYTYSRGTMDTGRPYTRLRRSGRQFVGLCPFHQERHPSFCVHPEKKLFYCFGCGAGGDVFDFVKRVKACDFPDALRIIAEFLSWGSPRERAREGRERFRAGEGAK